jgi:hypothetical protein
MAAKPLDLLLAQLESSLRRPVLHYLLLLAFALAFHGDSLSFGLLYDDHDLFGTHWDWMYSHWKDPYYYRPLQTVLFWPALVSSYPPLLHLENIAVGAAVIFLFGRLLVSLDFGLWFVFVIELVGVVLPTSMTLFRWISQRTEWPTNVLGLALVLLTFAGPPLRRWYVAWFAALSAAALLAKESGVTAIAVAPLFIAAYHGRRRQAIFVAAAGTAVFGAYWVLRSHVLPHPIDTLSQTAGKLLLGLLETAVYPYIQVCFTTNRFYLALNAASMAMGVGGLVAMLRSERRQAIALLVVLLGFALGTALNAEPRELVVPGLIATTFTCYGASRMVASSPGWRRSGLIVGLFVANTCALANTSVLSSYALQDWVGTMNGRLEASTPVNARRGNLHEIDVNTRFRGNLRAWILRHLGP